MIERAPERKQISLGKTSAEKLGQLSEHLAPIVKAFSRSTGHNVDDAHYLSALETAIGHLSKGKLPPRLPTEGQLGNGGALPAMRLVEGKDGKLVFDFPVSRSNRGYAGGIGSVSGVLKAKRIRHRVRNAR